jgi:phosphoribosylaminoimidazole-succinocarboxamide synthase
VIAGAYLRSGKVRDLYAVGPDRILLVASDRISAFDVVLPTPIPDKGRVLTGLSRFWFGSTAEVVTNHLVSTDPADLPADVAPIRVAADLRGRMMLCRRAEVLPVEIVVRGYLAGSGWKDYRATGAICGVRLPAGLRESDRLPAPILTPATKAPAGEHDENIDFDAMVERLAGHVGPAAAGPLAERVRDVALRLYGHGAAVCERAGLILADTKYELGLDPETGGLLLVDEVMTPDSARFWDAAAYAPGGPQPSFDKQYVRDWLETQPWPKTAPGPVLPAAVVAGTRARYVEAYERITRASFDRYLREDVVGR